MVDHLLNHVVSSIEKERNTQRKKAIKGKKKLKTSVIPDSVSPYFKLANIFIVILGNSYDIA